MAGLPGWVRDGDTVTHTFRIRYHGGVAMIVHVADVERLVGHHAGIDLRWDYLQSRVTTPGTGSRQPTSTWLPGSTGAPRSTRRSLKPDTAGESRFTRALLSGRWQGRTSDNEGYATYQQGPLGDMSVSQEVSKNEPSAA